MRARGWAVVGAAAAAWTLTGAGAAGVPGTSDVHRLPIGGAPGTTPAVGTVDACQTHFAANGGAQAAGSWINGDGTFDLTKKPAVQGSVTWPQAKITIARSGSQRVITTNDLPVGDPTGTFPIASTDPAYQFDRNPNSIRAQSITVRLAASPKLASKPTCTPGGPVGVMLNGVLVYNALDGAGRDAVAYEIQDACNGHPMMAGEYHSHSLSTCLASRLDSGTSHSKLLGYAADGFGIYGPRGDKGQVLTDADLDACHGRTDTITWDGKRVRMYHYVATAEYPYTIGCFRGTPVTIGGAPGGGGGGAGPGGGGGGPGGGPPGGPPGGGPP